MLAQTATTDASTFSILPSFVRENHAREAEMDEATKQSAQVVETGNDIWTWDKEGVLAQRMML
jgi:ferritin